MKIKRESNKNAELISKMKDIFKDHIGMENAIPSEQLYFKITGDHPDDVEFFLREYKWNLVKRILGALRKNGELFVVMGTSYHYVLDSEDELESYKNRIDATIKGLHAMKKKAENWINSEELKKLKKKEKEKEKKKVDKILAMTS